MSIKNKEAYLLAKQLSKLTRESLTMAVIKGVRERLTVSVGSRALI